MNEQLCANLSSAGNLFSGNHFTSVVASIITLLNLPVVDYTLPQAAEAISQNHFGFTGYYVSDAVKQVNSCNNKFSELVLAPLGNRNGVVHKFVDVASAIIKQLLKD
ncbi:unnamed protein product [Vicia faba]|uniref:Uncharacterized protein n=1 Tax=Vicia faba TaxID=3906 RepID=A0AAV0ZE89_VICFA|nr:unnamed protein product [Vicia faba]